MTARSDWRRVSKRHPCPICEKPDWCAVSADGAVALCQRVQSSKRVGDAGWLHRLRDAHGWHRRRKFTARAALAKVTKSQDFEQLAELYERAAGDDAVTRLARDLGIAVESLRLLGIGWSAHHRAWSFPMTDPNGIVRGIRLRRPNGFKFAVTGGRDGLFIPGSPTDGDDAAPLFICEGPTDTAALRDIGFRDVVGRPSCTGGTAYVMQLARGRQVVIVADSATPGQRGAIRLAGELRGVCPLVRIIVPPPGIKDARAWLRAGARRSDIEVTIRNGPIVRFAEPTRRAVGESYCGTR